MEIPGQAPSLRVFNENAVFLSEAWDLYDRILSDPQVTLVQEQEEQEPKDVEGTGGHAWSRWRRVPPATSEWSTVGRRRAERTD